MTSKPTFVLVLGAWFSPSCYDPLRSRLTERGFPSESPAHPSIGAEPPTKTLGDDVAHLQALLKRLVEDEGKEVVVVMHSYGGVVGSQAVEGLEKASREKAGLKGGVVLMVYVAAFALEKGKSLLDMVGGKFLPWMKIEDDYITCVSPAETFLHDVPPAEQVKWNSTLSHTSRAVFSGPATYEPWHLIPSAYVLCEEDQALPLHVQELLVGQMQASLVYRLKASHSPFLSIPDRTTDILEELVGKV